MEHTSYNAKQHPDPLTTSTHTSCTDSSGSSRGHGGPAQPNVLSGTLTHLTAAANGEEVGHPGPPSSSTDSSSRAPLQVARQDQPRVRLHKATRCTAQTQTLPKRVTSHSMTPTSSSGQGGPAQPMVLSGTLTHILPVRCQAAPPVVEAAARVVQHRLQS